MPGSVTKLKVLTAMNRSYLQNRRVEFCKTLYLLRYGTYEHPRALSFEATPFNHAQSVIFNFPRGWISSELRSIFFDPFATSITVIILFVI